LIAAYVNHVVDCIRMSISRVFSCEVSAHTCVYMQITDYIPTSVSRVFSREIHWCVYGKHIAYEQSVYICTHTFSSYSCSLAMANLSTKIPSEISLRFERSPFQIDTISVVKLLADRVIATNYEWRISYRFHDVNSIDSHRWYGIKENTGNKYRHVMKYLRFMRRKRLAGVYIKKNREKTKKIARCTYSSSIRLKMDTAVAYKSERAF